MARGINKVILVGNLGRDPETRYMPSGGAVTNVSVATSKSWRDRDSGEQKERTEWHRVVFPPYCSWDTENLVSSASTKYTPCDYEVKVVEDIKELSSEALLLPRD